MSRDPRIDAYIDKAAPFARPVLEHLRELVHRVVPAAAETVKWGMPHFTYKTKNVAGMAAFKAHCAFIVHGDGRQDAGRDEGEGMGGYGKIAGMADLPDDTVLAAALKSAMAAIDTRGTALRPAKPAVAKSAIPVPPDFAAALRDSPAAKATFGGLAPSHKRDYLEWITEAKREETRGKRIAASIEWLAEGKRRNWKYEKR
ncbi:MAG: YdeI/OmpD-associated family protein [Croceibacterium sp.]